MFFYRNPLKWVKNLEISASSAWDPENKGFGFNVSGDPSLDTIVVSESDFNDSVGALSVYVRQDGQYELQQTLRPIGLSIEASDTFGSAYQNNNQAISTDKNIIAASAYEFSGNGKQGAVAIFRSGSNGYVQEQVLIPDISGANFYGYGCAISDDGTMLSVAEALNNEDGKIYLYKDVNGSFEKVQELITPNTFVGQDFGFGSVFFSEDNSKIIVGHGSATTDGENLEGAIYIYESGSSGYQIVNTIVDTDPSTRLLGGNSFSFSSDFTKIVSVVTTDPGYNKHRIKVFQSGSNGYEDVQTIVANSTGSSLTFNNINLSPDGEKIFTFASLYANNVGTSEIRVYASSSNGYQLSEQFSTSGTGVEANIAARVNQAGNLILAGDYRDSELATNAGAVYVYESGSNGWAQSQKILPEDDWDPADDVFGGTIELANNNEILGIHQSDSQNIRFQDGNNYVVRYNTDSVGGSIYIYEKDGEGYKQVQRILSPKQDEFTGFGYNFSFSRSGDKIAIPYSAASHSTLTGSVDGPVDFNRVFNGVVYIYESGSSGYSLVQEIKKDVPNNFFTFGQSTVFDNTTGNKLFLGGLDFNTGGSIYVYESGSSGYVQTQELTSGEPVVDGSDYFVYMKLSSDDQILLVGAPYDDTEAAANIGSLTIFVSGSTGYQKAQKLTPDDTTDPDGYMSFGYSKKTLAISEDNQTIVVGARAELVQPDSSVDRQGAVRIYQSGSSGYEQVQFIPAPEEDGVNGNLFGSSVDISGSFLAIGSIYDRQNATDPVSWTSKNRGSVWIYEKINGTYEKKYRIAAEGNRNYETSQSGGTWPDGWIGFGTAVKLLPNNEVLIGSPYDDKNGTDSGVVYKYKLTRDY